jgi:hypothetical protein
MSVEASGRPVAGLAGPAGPRHDGAIEEVSIGFHGEGAGTGELTWGQARILRMIQRSGRTMNLAGAMSLPEGTTVEEMAMVLGFVVGRNPALRTKLRFVDEPPGPGRVQQVVAESGHVPLQVHDVGDGDDPAAAAEQVRLGYELSAFDHENEYPVRMGVVRQAGAAVQLVVCYSHVMLDGAALELLIRDLQHLDRSTGEATAPAPSFSPLELARDQAGAAGIRQNGKALRHWAAELGRLSSSWRIDEPDEARNAADTRFWQLVGYSPAMELGLRAIAVRTGASSTHVLLAAYAVAAGRVLGRDPALAQIVVNNRFRPGLGEAVTQVSQPGICVVDVADATFDEVVHRAWKAVTSASLHGYYDPVGRDDLLEEIASRRGLPLDIDWHLNDRRGMAVSGPQPEESVPPEAELKAAMDDALPHTRMFWNHKRPTSDGTLFIHVDSSLQSFIPDDVVLDVNRPAVHLQVWVDTRHFPTARIESFVREMETVVVEAVFDPAVPTGVRRPPTAGL